MLVSWRTVSKENESSNRTINFQGIVLVFRGVICFFFQSVSPENSTGPTKMTPVVCLKKLRLQERWLGLKVYKGVSKNRGTAKWMVYNGKPY